MSGDAGRLDREVPDVKRPSREAERQNVAGRADVERCAAPKPPGQNFQSCLSNSHTQATRSLIEAATSCLCTVSTV